MAVSRPMTLGLLILNAVLYVVIMALAGYVVQAVVDPNIIFGLQVSQSGATTYMITLALISGAAGLGSVVCGFYLLHQSSTRSYNACLAVAAVAAVLTLETLGLSSREIYQGHFRNNRVKSLESLSIIAGSTQVFYVIMLLIGKQIGDYP